MGGLRGERKGERMKLDKDDRVGLDRSVKQRCVKTGQGEQR